MVTPVSPTFLKQEAKKIKKSQNILMSEALDEISKKFGFSNYRHYLNASETNTQTKSTKETVLKNIHSETDMLKKVHLAISFLENYQIPFHEQLDILKMFQHSHEFGQHPDFEWLDDVHFIGEKLNLMNEEVKQYLFNDFLTEEGINEIHSLQEYFKAKEISLSNLTYELRKDSLIVDGQYYLKTEFEFEIDKNDPVSLDERFKDRELFGVFGIKIDRDKSITVEHQDIGED